MSTFLYGFKHNEISALVLVLLNIDFEVTRIWSTPGGFFIAQMLNRSDYKLIKYMIVFTLVTIGYIIIAN